MLVLRREVYGSQPGAQGHCPHRLAVVSAVSIASQHLTCACWTNLITYNKDFCFCRHEHTSGYYRVSSYFFGKLLAELIPRRLLPSTVFSLITYVIAGK